jgi:hypothetical protein
MEERGVGDSALLYPRGDFPFPSAPLPILQVRQKLRLLPAIAPLPLRHPLSG